MFQEQNNVGNDVAFTRRTLVDALAEVSIEFGEADSAVITAHENAPTEAGVGKPIVKKKRIGIEGSTVKKGRGNGSTKQQQASISDGTNARHRASIDDEHWGLLKALAVQKDSDPAGVLRELIEKESTGKRGRGQKAATFQALHVLFKHVTLDLIRYEIALAAYLGCDVEPEPARSLVGAEAEDCRIALTRVILTANGALRANVTAVLRLVAEVQKGEG